MSEFDKYANNYRKVHSENLRFSGSDSEYFCEYKIREVLACESSPPSTVLDLGCGDGLSCSFFRQFFPKAAIHGIDVSEKSLQIAAARGISNATFRVYDGQNIPFDNDCFDLVFVSQVFHHLPHGHHVGLLKEIFRVLSPVGRLYVFEHNPLNPLTRYVVKTCAFDEDARLIMARSLIASCGYAGFRNIAKRYFLFFPRHSVFKPLIQIESRLGWLPFGAQYCIYATKHDCGLRSGM